MPILMHISFDIYTYTFMLILSMWDLSLTQFERQGQTNQVKVKLYKKRLFHVHNKKTH